MCSTRSIENRCGDTIVHTPYLLVMHITYSILEGTNTCFKDRLCHVFAIDHCDCRAPVAEDPVSRARC